MIYPVFIQELPSDAFPNFVSRAIALLIDSFVISIFISLFFGVFYKLGMVNVAMVVYNFYPLILPLYFIIMHKKYGATLGKKWCHMKVIKLNQAGLTYMDAIKRHSPHLIFVLLTFVDAISKNMYDVKSTMPHTFSTLTMMQVLWVIASIICLFRNRYNRTLHDFLANTVVIKV